MFTKIAMQLLLLALTLFGCITITISQEQANVGQKKSITPEKRALITELLEITESRKIAIELYQSILDQQEKQVPDLIWQALAGDEEIQKLTVEQREQVRKELVETSNRTSKRIRELFDERMDFSQIVEDASYELYDKYFTEAELKDLVGFYRTPTGKKAIAVTPKMFTESIEITIERIKPKMSEIMAILTKEESQRLSKELETLTSKQPVKAKPRRRKRKPA